MLLSLQMSDLTHFWRTQLHFLMTSCICFSVNMISHLYMWHDSVVTRQVFPRIPVPIQRLTVYAKWTRMKYEGTETATVCRGKKIPGRTAAGYNKTWATVNGSTCGIPWFQRFLNVLFNIGALFNGAQKQQVLSAGVGTREKWLAKQRGGFQRTHVHQCYFNKIFFRFQLLSRGTDALEQRRSMSCLWYGLVTLGNNERLKQILKGRLACRKIEQFLHSGCKVSFGNSSTKPFWTSTCNTDHNEVSASAKPLSAHKSRHNLSTYPLHLQELGWYFRPLLGVYIRILRREAQRNWRLISSCQKSPDDCSYYVLGDWTVTVLLYMCTGLCSILQQI